MMKDVVATRSQGDREGRPYKKTRELDAVHVLVRATLAVALQAALSHFLFTFP